MKTLQYTNRKVGENKEGMLKAVFYGAKEKSTPIFIEAISFQKIFREAGESTIINLEGDKKLSVLIKDITFDSVKNFPIHVDFYVVEKGSKVETKVPLVFQGVSEGVKLSGGSLVKVIHEIHIEAEADKLPHEIIVDISILKNPHDVIHIKDLVLPKGVSLYHQHAEDIIASIAIQDEEDLSTPISADISNIKVEEKGKKEVEAEK